MARAAHPFVAVILVRPAARAPERTQAGTHRSDSSSLDPAAPAEGQTLARRIESLRRAQARERDAAAVNRSRSVPSDLATTLLHLGGRW